MDKDTLAKIIDDHHKWLQDSSKGARANLSYANLSYANLLSANLRSADLSSANLSSADLSYANLSSANLRHANLRSADLRYAKIASVLWCAPTTVLLANWGTCSDNLTIELMRYDAYNHEDPYSFDLWVADNTYPFGETKYQRAAHFTEKRELWPGWNPRKKVKSAYELMQLLLAEKCEASE